MKETIHNLQELEVFAAKFLAAHPKGGAFGLVGTLGVGKTTFVKAVLGLLAKKSGKTLPRVLSPSYVFHQSYQVGVSVDHFDLYRTDSLTEAGLIELGYWEAWERSQEHGGYLFVEWPERGNQLLRLNTQLGFEFEGDIRVITW